MKKLDNSLAEGRATAHSPRSRQAQKATHCFNWGFALRAVLTGGTLLCLSALPSISAAQTYDSAYEQQLGKTIESSLKNGAPLWLDDSQTKFFAVFNPDQSGQPKGGVIILHDANSHPDKSEVIRPLRQDLPEHGWATISIQLPYLNSVSDYIDKQSIINKRIESAIAHLQSSGLNNIALLGHGSGAMAATTFLASQTNSAVQAFVAVSLGIIDSNKSSEPLGDQLAKITLPILDIYGSNDLDYVTNTAKSRALAAKISSNSATRSNRLDAFKRSAMAKSSFQRMQGYISYRQIKIEGADHDFTAAPFLLTKRIIGWLERHAKGVAVNSTP